MPELSVVDAHMHLWNPAARTYPWIAVGSPLDRAFQIGDYRAARQAIPVAGAIFVEAGAAAGQELAEAEWVLAQAQGDLSLCGLVINAPLERGDDARPILEGARRLSPLVKGVRRNLQDESDPAFCLQPAFVAGVALLEPLGFSFDLCIRYHQLPAATGLARRCPGVRFILDHAGKPPIGVLEPWKRDLTALADLPNVACKISGLVTEADHQTWTEHDLEPYVAHALEVFGPDRVLFGSDWPVVTLAASYERWVAALDSLTASLPVEQRRALWADNALRWYRAEAPTAR